MILIVLLNIKKIVMMEMNKILLFPILVSEIFMMILNYFVPPPIPRPDRPSKSFLSVLYFLFGLTLVDS